MKKRRTAITFLAILGVVSILWIESIVSAPNIDTSKSSPVITSDEYRGVEIEPDARGKVTEADVDAIIEEYGTDGVKVYDVQRGKERNYRNYVFGVIWCIALCGVIVCFRQNHHKVI